MQWFGGWKTVQWWLPLASLRRATRLKSPSAVVLLGHLRAAMLDKHAPDC